MTRLLLTCLLACWALVALSVQAQETKVYLTDQFGRIENSKPSLTLQPDGRTVEVDPYGHPRYDKPGFQVQAGPAPRPVGSGRPSTAASTVPDGKIYQTETYGHEKQQVYVVENGKVYETDRYGHRKQPAYVIQGDTVHATDAYGNRKQPAYVVKPPPVKK